MVVEIEHLFVWVWSRLSSPDSADGIRTSWRVTASHSPGILSSTSVLISYLTDMIRNSRIRICLRCSENNEIKNRAAWKSWYRNLPARSQGRAITYPLERGIPLRFRDVRIPVSYPPVEYWHCISLPGCCNQLQHVSSPGWLFSLISEVYFFWYEWRSWTRCNSPVRSDFRIMTWWSPPPGK